MKKGKRALSLLLAALLIVCGLPLSAGAADAAMTESEPNDALTLANRLSYGPWMMGALDTESDRDIYRFVPERRNIELYVASDIPAVLHVYDQNGSDFVEPVAIVGGSREDITDDWAFWDLEKGQTYYIGIEPVDGQTGEYAISLENVYTPFTDISSHWGRDSIEWAFFEELFSGVSETLFGPDRSMTRAMAVTVLYNWAGRPAVSGSSGFSDVPAKAYYANAVTWAVQNGIASGVGKNRFDPNSNVRREQLVSMLFRMLDEGTVGSGDLSAFSDGNKVSGYAKEAMKWAVGEEILSGSNGKLNPQGFATRAQVARILDSMSQRYVWTE